MNQMPKFQSSPTKGLEGSGAPSTTSKTSPGGVRLKQQNSVKLGGGAYVNAQGQIKLAQPIL